MVNSLMDNCTVKQKVVVLRWRDSTNLNPMMGHSLQMLHLAWCLAVSAAATRCRTGNHTMDWGSRRIQSRNMAASSSGLLLAWKLQEARYVKLFPIPN